MVMVSFRQWSSSPDDDWAEGTQPRAKAFVLRHNPPERRPEPCRMSPMKEVDQLVRDDVGRPTRRSPAGLAGATLFPGGPQGYGAMVRGMSDDGPNPPNAVEDRRKVDHDVVRGEVGLGHSRGRLPRARRRPTWQHAPAAERPTAPRLPSSRPDRLGAVVFPAPARTLAMLWFGVWRRSSPNWVAQYA
jgi:hypothetical protein